MKLPCFKSLVIFWNVYCIWGGWLVAGVDYRFTRVTYYHPLTVYRHRSFKEQLLCRIFGVFGIVTLYGATSVFSKKGDNQGFHSIIFCYQFNRRAPFAQVRKSLYCHTHAKALKQVLEECWMVIEWHHYQFFLTKNSRKSLHRLR